MFILSLAQVVCVPKQFNSNCSICKLEKANMSPCQPRDSICISLLLIDFNLVFSSAPPVQQETCLRVHCFGSEKNAKCGVVSYWGILTTLLIVYLPFVKPDLSKESPITIGRKFMCMSFALFLSCYFQFQPYRAFMAKFQQSLFPCMSFTYFQAQSYRTLHVKQNVLIVKTTV